MGGLLYCSHGGIMARLCSLPSSFGSLSFGVGTKGLEEPFSPSLPLRFLPFESTNIEIAKVIPVPYAGWRGRSAFSSKLLKTYVCTARDKNIKRKDSKKALNYEYRFLNTNRMIKAGVAPKVPIKTISQNEKYIRGITSWTFREGGDG